MTGSRTNAALRTFAPRLVLLAVALTLFVFLLVDSAVAAGPAPAWKLTAASHPTNLIPGSTGGGRNKVPQYDILATNVGAAPTSGAIVVTVVLPAGLTPITAEGADYAFEHGFPCSVDAQTVTCTDENPLGPGKWLQVVVGLEVVPGASGSLLSRASVSGGGAAPASTVATTTVSAAPATFDFLPGAAGLSAAVIGSEGDPATQAGSHPYQLTADLGFPSTGTGEGEGAVGNALTAAGHLRDLTLDLPRGVIFNPNASPVLCTETQLESEGCPDASQVGTVTVMTVTGTSVAPSTSPLYNMVPPIGAPAVLGFDALGLGIFVHPVGGVRTGRDYGLSATSHEILARSLNPVLGAQVQLWGDPSSSSHDELRGKCVFGGSSCPVVAATTPLLTMPSACSSSLMVGASADSWEEPGRVVGRSAELEGPVGEAVRVSGCQLLRFGPTIAIQPEVGSAETPTGLHVDLHVPQTEGLNTLATANLEDAKVTLPAGFAVSPSAANGLGACTEAQIELHGPEPARCPDDAKIGSVEVDTPLLDHPLPGAVYVAKPHENPFGSLLAIYIAVDDPQSGVVIKLAGHVEADPVTGQLTTSFDENPELPFEDFKLDFFGGPRAALRTPSTCGAYRSEGEFAPWSGTPPVHTGDSFTISRGANGMPCASSESAEPNAPIFEAGTATPLAAAFSPFVMHLSRADGTQRLKALNLTLPPGLTGKLAGIPYCPDATINAAGSRSGRAEQASPSCPPASEVGTVTVGAGPGPQPYYVTGRAYLGGPYKGAPYSLAIITPAVAGPYDLGTVVVRAGLYVNQRTAQISVRSDEIPHILAGIPLDIRSIAVSIDRSQFTLNPTNCEAMALTGEAISLSGQAAPLHNRFQVGGCKGLDFRPRLALRVFGKTNRNAKPRFRAVLQASLGEANIKRAQVNLPHSEFLEQGHIKTVCTRVQYALGDGNGSACPKGSIYGYARAWTPLLDRPLQGPVYLRSSSHELPDLVAALNGQVQITLVGKVDSGPNKGIRNTFEVVPDAPVSKFILTMKGGKKGLLVNSENLCRKHAKARAIVRLTGQNGAVEHWKPKVRNSCGKSHRAHRPAGTQKRRNRIFSSGHRQ